MYQGPIEKGWLYMDTKRRNSRKIVDIGPQYARFPDQKCKDCLRYVVMRQGSGPYRPGDQVDCTVESFRKWVGMCIRPTKKIV